MINLPNQGNVNSVPPQTELRLYSGVPWDNSYNHVRLYDSTLDLLSHLEQWRIYPSVQLDELTPIRVGSYELKVPFNEMEGMNINYLAFRNLPYSTEWTFCFVTGVLYKSPYTTQMKFELDIFQNNFYKCNVKPCFIEYQHINRSDDVIGGNLIPVNIETGEPIVADYSAYQLNNWHICVYVTEGTTGKDFDGKVVNNVYRAASLGHKSIDDNGEKWANELIKAYNDVGKVDAILALFMSPELCVNAINGKDNEDDKFIGITGNFFEGYVPKNKKLYSYPWCYVLADNNEGQTAIYRFELSNRNDKSIDFHIMGCINTLPQTIMFPINYKGNLLNYTDGMVNSAFPICAWSSDTFRAWIAQNKSTLGLSAMSGAMSIMSGFMNGTISAAAAPFTGGASLMNLPSANQQINSGIQNTLGLLAEVSDKSRQPATAHGKVLSENINAGFNITGISFYTMTCKREFAEIADSFFETYGYPINKITTPLLNSRSSWNYIKTQNCGFSGAIEMSQLSGLRSIFDKGVTLWHTDDVGNYNLSNN